MKESSIEIESEVVSEPQQQLAVVITNSGLELESAQSLKLAFAPLFDQAEEWRKKVAAINVTVLASRTFGTSPLNACITISKFCLKLWERVSKQ